MNDSRTALLRIPAFLIDFALIVSLIAGINKLGIYLEILPGMLDALVVMFVCIPVGFVLYWVAGLNVGKRLFRLHIVDATTGGAPTLFQYLRRGILFAFVVSLNLLFLNSYLCVQKKPGVP